MAKRSSRRTRVNWVTVTMACVVVVFLVLVSVQERLGADFGLLELTEIEVLRDLLSDIPETSGQGTDPEVAEHIANAGVSVHFIDVGQGKAIFIETPEKTVLIDAGERDQGQRLLRYFDAHNVDSIDIAIGTHPHSDHIGGMGDVIGGIPISSVVLPVIPEENTPTTATYTALLQSIAEEGLEITPAKDGDSFDLGGEAKLVLLGPLKDYEDLNNMSIVSRLEYGATSFLFTGDAMAFAERDMLEAGKNLKSTVLDVGHHGSSTSTQARFLKEVMPRIAVISCGIDNVYGHPHREIMERLTEYGVQVYRTDLNGSVIISSDGKSLGVQTEK